MTLRRPTELRAPTPTAADSAAFRGRPETAAPDRIEITTALLIVAIALVPVTWGTVLWAAPRGDADFNRRVTVQLFDFALALAACPTLATFVARPQVVAEHWRRWTVRRNAMLGTVILLLAPWRSVCSRSYNTRLFVVSSSVCAFCSAASPGTPSSPHLTSGSHASASQ
jgi:hypothetical protein